MRLRLICNGAISPPQIYDDEPGKWRDILHVGRRIEVTIDDPEIEDAMIDAIEAGFYPEFWVEDITEE